MPFTLSNTAVKTFRHAVALDEHRAKFQPVHWHAPNKSHRKVAKNPTGELGMRDLERLFIEDEAREAGKKGETDIDEVPLQRVWGLAFNADAFICRCGLLDVIVVCFYFSSFWYLI
jgi:hypothetical protein